MDNLLTNQIKKLMDKHPDLFPTEAKFWSYLRGCLRRGLWEKSPMKFKFKNSSAIKPPEGYKGKGRKGHICALTGEWVMTSKAEVDHIEGHKPLLKESDIIPYIIHLLATEDSLQMVDKEAHKIKTHAERKGLSFEEAVIDKKVIEYLKKPVKDVVKVLTEHNLPSNNNTVRRKGIKQLFEEGELK